MKKSLCNLVVLTFSMLLVSCRNTDVISRLNDKSGNTGESSQFTTPDEEKETSTNETKGEGISLFMYGDLLPNAVRSVYVKFDKEVYEEEFTWTTSDASLVTVEGRNGPLPECILHSLGTKGKVTITATGVNDPSVKASMDLEIKDGESINPDVFASLQGSMKLTLDEKDNSYDDSYSSTADKHYSLDLTYEENVDSSIPDKVGNLTDAYELKEKNLDSDEEKVYSYVRSRGGSLAKEKVDIHNKLDYELLKNDDDQTVSFDNTYYVNPFGVEKYGTFQDWVSYDGGKTFHFIGGYLQSSYICASIMLKDLSPDDMWIGVEGEKLTFNVLVDPYNKDDAATTKYGMTVTGEFSELGTAKIEHLKTFGHESYQDGFEKARKAMSSLKNYKAEFTLDYPNQADDLTYSFIYTEDTIDQVVTKADGTKEHTGIHKKEDGTYYAYKYDDSKKTLTITKEYDTLWEGKDKDGNEIHRYPTFDFASEIFANKDSDGYYFSRSNNGIFIIQTAYVPTSFNSYLFENEGGVKLTEDGNYFASIKENINALGEDLTFTLNFSEFTSAKTDIDFSDVTKPAEPTSWDEYASINKSFVEDLKAWNLAKYIPFKYVPQGWKTTLGWNRDVGEHAAYAQTKPFKDQAELDAFLKEYQDLIVKDGYTATNDKDANNNGGTIYTKGDAKISIAEGLNWNDKPDKSITIWVYAPDVITQPY